MQISNDRAQRAFRLSPEGYAGSWKHAALACVTKIDWISLDRTGHRCAMA